MKPETIAPSAIEAGVKRSSIGSYLFRRWLGAWIDFIVLALCLLIPDFLLGNPLYQQTIWIWLILPILYFPVLEGIWGRSLGKLITGTVVVDSSGNVPGIWKAILRTIPRIVEVDPLLVGGLIAGIAAAVSENRQRLGDMLARTYVMRVKDLAWARSMNDVSGL